jgi:hypothetical protein
MAFFRRNTAVLERPAPLSIAGATQEIIPEDYDDLCETLRYTPVELVRARVFSDVMEFFQKNDIPVYSQPAVEAYLTALAKQKKMMWGWAPLRGEQTYANGRYWQVYAGKIPVEALRRAAKIKIEYPREAEFFVSAFGKPIPDPFMAVKIKDVDGMIVFAVWDEPAYTSPTT